jgi:Fe2+ transport system protein B
LGNEKNEVNEEKKDEKEIFIPVSNTAGDPFDKELLKINEKLKEKTEETRLMELEIMAKKEEEKANLKILEEIEKQKKLQKQLSNETKKEEEKTNLKILEEIEKQKKLQTQLKKKNCVACKKDVYETETWDTQLFANHNVYFRDRENHKRHSHVCKICFARDFAEDPKKCPGCNFKLIKKSDDCGCTFCSVLLYLIFGYLVVLTPAVQRHGFGWHVFFISFIGCLCMMMPSRY